MFKVGICLNFPKLGKWLTNHWYIRR